MDIWAGGTAHGSIEYSQARHHSKCFYTQTYLLLTAALWGRYHHPICVTVSRGVGSSVQGQQCVLGFSDPRPALFDCAWPEGATGSLKLTPWVLRKSMILLFVLWTSFTFGSVVYLCWFPSSNFLLSVNWGCMPLWWWPGCLDPGCAPTCVHLLQAARHSSFSSACSTLSLSLQHMVPEPHFGHPGPGAWSCSLDVPACVHRWAWQRSLLELRKVFNCRSHPHLKSSLFTFWHESFLYVAETLLSTHVSHCWPHPNL